MAQRRIRWPLLLTVVLFAGGVMLLFSKPQLLSSAATRLVNRQLQAHADAQLRVGTYHVRIFEGIDLLDVSLVTRGASGGLTRIAVDTMQVDFRLRSVLGRSVTLRRLAAWGVNVYLHEGETAAASGGATLSSLPRLAVEHLDLRRARVTVSRSDGRLRERIEDLYWRGELDLDDDRMQLVVRSGRLNWPTRGTRLDRIFGSAVVSSDGVHVAELSAAWNDGQATVSGSLGTEGLEFSATGRNLSVEDVDNLIDLNLGFEARGDIDCTVAARYDTVLFRGSFTGRLVDWDLREVEGEAVIVDGLADFSTMRGNVGGAWFDGSLLVDERSDPTQAIITIAGRGRDLDLRAGLIPDVPDLPQTAGSGRLQIIHTTGDAATHVRGLLTDGCIEFMPFDTCRVDVWARDDSLHFRSIVLRRGSIEAGLTGSSDRRGVFRGQLRLAVADLVDMPPEWGWPQLQGSCEGRLQLHGPLDALDASGALALHGAGLGPVSATTTEVALHGRRILGDDWMLAASATGDGFAIGNVPLGRYRSGLRVDSRSAVLDSFHAVHGDTVVSLAGRADIGPESTGLLVDRLMVGLGGVDWHTPGPVAAVVGRGLLELPHMSLVSDQGELTAAVAYDTARELLDGRAMLRNIDLDILDTFLDWPMRTGGRVSARLELGGRPAEPSLVLRGELSNAAFPLARIDSLFVRGSLLGGIVRLDTLVMASDQGHVELQGSIANPGADAGVFWPGASLEIAIEVQHGDWAFLQQFQQPALERIAGHFDARLHLSGTTDDPLITGEFESSPFSFQWLNLQHLNGVVRADAAQLAFGNLRGRHGALELEGRLEIPLRFDLMSEPLTPDDGPFYGYVRVPPGTDLGPLMHATRAFTRSAGRGEAELTVAGPLSRPRYQGRLAADDLEIVLRDTEEVYQEGKVRGVFEDDKLILHEISGKAGLRGEFAGAGTVTFDGLELRTWDISFEADRFLVASIPDLRVLVRTRNGRLTGETVGPDQRLVPRFGGDYELIRGRYTGSFAETNGGQDPTLGTIAPDWLANLRLTGSPRTMRVTNRNMELDLSGDVSLVRDADGMILNGSMNIDTGRLPVFNNTFKVVRGRLDFSREIGVVPVVDIDAETRVRVHGQVGGHSVVERLTVHAAGPANAMTISYSSESGYPREAIERMLLGLSPFPEEHGDQAALTSASIGAGLNLIEREIASEIARGIGLFDTFEIDQIQRQQLGATGLDPLIGVGKYLGTDFYIKYAQGLNQNDSDLVIEYQITDHLLLQTERRRRIDEYQGDATWSLDLKYRFEY